MKRKTSSLPSRVWTFGVRPPAENAALFQEQLFNAHKYYNMLIEIERGRREAFRKLRADVADLAPLEAQHASMLEEIAAVRTELKAKRSAARTRVAASPELKERLSILSAARKEQYAQLKAARLALADDPGLKAGNDALSAETTVKVKAARASCGVYWGSYLLVEKAVEAARKSPADPEFHRWRGEGRVGVQLHHEKFADVISGQSTMLRLSLNEARPRPDGSFSKRSQKRRFGTLQLRAGSEGRAPIWVSFPVILHRLPPPEATLSWAWVKVTKLGSDTRLELQLTVESEAFHNLPCGKGVAAVDVGWRVRADGDLRVAYLRDDQGKERELRLPARLLSGLRFADELRGHQSRHFDTARDVWAAWLAGQELPEWLAEVRQYIGLWKSPARMAKAVGKWITESENGAALEQLWDTWRDERLGAKEDLFASLDEVSAFVERTSAISGLSPIMFYMELWRRKNRHLHDWEAHQRDKCLGRRRDIYRNFAADVAKTYKTVVFEDMDHRDLAKNAKPEEGAGLDHLHRVRNVASPGLLRSTCVSAMGKARVEEEKTADSTRECDHCRHVNDWTESERAMLVLTCNGCGESWDQDANAAKVLLRRYFERFGDDGNGSAKAAEPAAPVSPKGSVRKGRSQTGSQVQETIVP